MWKDSFTHWSVQPCAVIHTEFYNHPKHDVSCRCIRLFNRCRLTLVFGSVAVLKLLRLSFAPFVSQTRAVTNRACASQGSAWTGGRLVFWCSRWWRAGRRSTSSVAQTIQTKTQKTTSSKVTHTRTLLRRTVGRENKTAVWKHATPFY